MVIYENNFPQFLESIAIGPDPSFLEKNTTNCEFVSAFPEEVDLIYTLKAVKRSSDPLNHMRHFVKKVCIFGPDLDTPTLNHMVKCYNNFPPYHRDIINIEIGLAFNKARKLAKSPTNCNSLYKLLGVKIPLNIPIPDDLNFICKLADGLRGCKKPCNYFKKTGDSMGILSDFMRGMSTSSNVLGDIVSDVIHAPLNIATNVYNKINPIIRKEFVALSVSSERLVKEGVAPFFPKETKKKIVDAVNKGQTTDKIRHLLGGDMKTYHAVSKTSSSVVSKIQQYLGDCFRRYDHGVRYNPYDPMYNSAYSNRGFMGVKNGNILSLVDRNGALAPNIASEYTADRMLNSKNDSDVRKTSDSRQYTPRHEYINPNAGSEQTVNGGSIPEIIPTEGIVREFPVGRAEITRYGYEKPNEANYDKNSSLGKGYYDESKKIKGDFLLKISGYRSIAMPSEQTATIPYGSIIKIDVLKASDRTVVVSTKRQLVDKASSNTLKQHGIDFLIDDYDPTGDSDLHFVTTRMNYRKDYIVRITILPKEPIATWTPSAVKLYASAYTNNYSPF